MDDALALHAFDRINLNADSPSEPGIDQRVHERPAFADLMSPL